MESKERGPLQNFLDAIKQAKKDGAQFLEFKQIFPQLFDGDHRSVAILRDDKEVLVQQVYPDAVIKQVFDKWLAEQSDYMKGVVNRLVNGAR